MEALRRRHGSADYRAAQGVMRQVLVRAVNEHYEEALAAIRCPVTLVWGADDEVAPLAMARVAAGQMCDAHLIEVPGAGHLTPLTAPESLHSAVERALSLPGPSG
jgi:pimeloyl-ACP methyl ester carboxylesterase